jgi:hypothetical protein
LLSPLLIACGLVALTAGVMAMDGLMDAITWREKTIPLTSDVIDDLCYKFDLSPDDDRCDYTGKEIYGPDFFDVLYETFTPRDQPWATQEEVDEMIGDYKYKCEPPSMSGDGRDYIVCRGVGAKIGVDKEGKERVILDYGQKQEKHTLSPKRIIPCTELGRI